jgi:YggT family protein
VIGEGVQFLLQSLGNLFVIALLLRFEMQLFRVPFRNPFAQFIVAVTDFVVKPARRVIPGLFGLDLPTLVLALLIELGVVVAVYWLSDFPFALAGARIWPVMLGLGLVRLASLAVYLLIGMSLVRAVLSWVNPYSPLMPVVTDLTEPFTRPFRRIIPLVGNVDLSPLALIIVCQLVLIVPIQATERMLLGQF